MDLIPLTSRRACARGFTLAEYLVATSIGLLAIAAALVLWAYASKTCATLLGYVDLSSASKNALDQVSQEVRNAKGVQSCSATQLVVRVPPRTGTNNDIVTFGYDASNQRLIRTLVKGANGARESKVLLTECTNFQFSVYTRVPSNSNFGLNTTWTTNEAKVVQMQWTCIRQITGDKSSVESQVSSKVVIRNQ
jgi:hypothetical protein